MKHLFIACILIFSCHSYCNAQSLDVYIRACRIKDNREVDLYEFKLYKNDVLIQTVHPHNDSKLIRVKDLGTYRIEYKTIFGMTENVFVDVSINKKYTVELCIDYYNYAADPYVPIISRLQNGESYTIEISTQGCFHHSDDTILVLNRLGNFYIVSGGIERKLSKSDIEAIKHFEIELNHIISSGCTTEVTYVLKYKDLQVLILDDSCNWDGDRHLKTKLKLVKE